MLNFIRFLYNVTLEPFALSENIKFTTIAASFLSIHPPIDTELYHINFSAHKFWPHEQWKKLCAFRIHFAKWSDYTHYKNTIKTAWNNLKQFPCTCVLHCVAYNHHNNFSPIFFPSLLLLFHVYPTPFSHSPCLFDWETIHSSQCRFCPYYTTIEYNSISIVDMTAICSILGTHHRWMNKRNVSLIGRMFFLLLPSYKSVKCVLTSQFVSKFSLKFVACAYRIFNLHIIFLFGSLFLLPSVYMPCNLFSSCLRFILFWCSAGFPHHICVVYVP